MYNYKLYLVISLASLCIGLLCSMLGIDNGSELFALIAYISFAFAVGVVAIEELFSTRPRVAKKIKSFFFKWKK